MTTRKTGTISTGDWVITLLILAIPLANLIMLFVWAFGSGTNINKANFAKAALIWVAISIVLGIIITVTTGAAMFSIFNQTGGY